MRVFPYNLKAHLFVEGEDAADFLQSQFSNDLRPFNPGEATYGLWLDVKGKVIADSWVVCEGEESFRLLSEHCAPEVIQEKLEQHIIADDVEISQEQPVFGVSIIGQESDVPEPPDGLLCWTVGRRSAERSAEYWFMSAGSRDAFLDSLSAELLDESLANAERIRAGIPLIPQEIGAAELPGEGGLERHAVSFTKGCFLGQEVVARMHNVGKPTRRLFSVLGGGEVPTFPSAVVSGEGKRVGELKSAYESEGGASWFGVALLKTRYFEEELELEGAEGHLRVVSLLEVTANE